MAEVHNRSHVADLRGRLPFFSCPLSLETGHLSFAEDTPTDLEPPLLLKKDSSKPTSSFPDRLPPLLLHVEEDTLEQARISS